MVCGGAVVVVCRHLGPVQHQVVDGHLLRREGPAQGASGNAPPALC